MPDPKTNPAAPAAAPAPAAPAPAVPAATPKPAAEPRAARPTQPAPAAPSIKPPVSSTRPRPSITAKKALGLEETPRKAMEAVVKSGRERISATSPSIEPKVEVPIIAAPAPAPEPAAPPVESPTVPAPAAPAKIKVGEKEYTPEELEAALKASSQPPAPAAPAPQREEAAPAAPAPQLTKEQIEAAEKKFVDDTMKVMDAPLTEAEMDTILAGGKDAVETLQALRKRDMAKTILETRKSMADSLNPLFDEVFNALRPLVANYQQVQRYTVEQQFVAKHADFVPHVDTARAVAEELVKLYPQQVSKMSQEQFIDEVARQTDLILTAQHKRWFPQGNGNWRTAPAPAPAAPTAAAAPVTAPPPVAPAAAPAPTRVVRAPAATVPVGGGGTPPPGWGKSVASSMRG